MGNETHVFRQIGLALATGWIVLTFLWGPVLALVQPGILAVSGLLFAFAVAWSVLSYRMEWNGPWDLPAPLALGLAAGILQPAISDVVTAQKANVRRCEAVQADMLKAHPQRSDGPDLFQALGCRPQGFGSVHAPARRGSGS